MRSHLTPISAFSLYHLRSSQGHDLFLPHVKTTMGHTRSFASIGPSLWNHFPPPIRSFILSAPLSSSLSSLKSYLFPRTEMPLKALLFGLHREKRYINIYIQYNTFT